MKLLLKAAHDDQASVEHFHPEQIRECMLHRHPLSSTCSFSASSFEYSYFDTSAEGYAQCIPHFARKYPAQNFCTLEFALLFLTLDSWDLLPACEMCGAVTCRNAYEFLDYHPNCLGTTGSLRLNSWHTGIPHHKKPRIKNRFLQIAQTVSNRWR